MLYEGTRPRRRLWSVIAVAGALSLLVVGLVLLGIFGSGDAGAGPAADGGGRPQPGGAPVPQEQPSRDTPQGSADPVLTAQAWLRAYRTVQFTDRNPTSWVDRLEPLLTEPAAEQAREQQRQGVAGASWERFVAQRCRTTVVGLDGVVPAEAPHTPDLIYVQVAGIVTTDCEQSDGSQNPPPPEHVAATLELRRMTGTTWLVSRRLY